MRSGVKWGSAVIVLMAGIAGCAPLKEAPPESNVQELVTKPLTPEESQELLEDAGDNWLYGHGIGSTAANIGAVVMFPPFALYLLGQGAMSLAGYEPLGVTDALPEEAQETWNDTYDNVVSIPGRAAAFAADRDFIDRETAKARIKEHLMRHNERKAPSISESQRTRSTASTGNTNHDPTPDSTYRARYSAGH